MRVTRLKLANLLAVLFRLLLQLLDLGAAVRRDLLHPFPEDREFSLKLADLGPLFVALANQFRVVAAGVQGDTESEGRRAAEPQGDFGFHQGVMTEEDEREPEVTGVLLPNERGRNVQPLLCAR